jgi:hypothetical protein
MTCPSEVLFDIFAAASDASSGRIPVKVIFKCDLREHDTHVTHVSLADALDTSTGRSIKVRLTWPVATQ